MYPPQNPYPSSSSESGPSSNQNPYPQGTYYGAYPPQSGPYQQQQGVYPPQSGPYQQQQGAYAPNQGPYVYPPQGSYVPAHNGRAQRAMIYGFISLGLGLITLFTLVGYAGIITGIFSIVYGVQGLGVAKRIPGGKGRGQSITAIVLGSVALFLVVIAFIIRAALGTSS